MVRSDEIVKGIIGKKGSSGSITPEQKEAVLDDVLNKIQPIQEQHMLVQQPIGRFNV